MEYGRIPRSLNKKKTIYFVVTFPRHYPELEVQSHTLKQHTHTHTIAQYQQLDGAFTKPYVIANAKTMPPAVWWATYGKHLPHLAAVARRVLAQPVCASSAERNWSVYGAIKTAARGKCELTGDPHSTREIRQDAMKRLF